MSQVIRSSARAAPKQAALATCRTNSRVGWPPLKGESLVLATRLWKE